MKLSGIELSVAFLGAAPILCSFLLANLLLPKKEFLEMASLAGAPPSTEAATLAESLRTTCRRLGKRMGDWACVWFILCQAINISSAFPLLAPQIGSILFASPAAADQLANGAVAVSAVAAVGA